MSKRRTLEEWKIELVGKQFGRLTVLDVQPHIRKSSCRRDGYETICRCLCGNEIIVLANSLLSNNTKSCGCLNKESSLLNLKKAREKLKDWEREHPEIVKSNREKGIKACKKWKEDHPDRVKEITRERLCNLKKWRRSHLDVVKEHNIEALKKAHQWQKTHKEEFLSSVRENIKSAIQWNKDHPDKFKEHSERGLLKAHVWIKNYPEEVSDITKRRLLGYHKWRESHQDDIACINKEIGRNTVRWRKEHPKEVRGKLLSHFSSEEKEIYNYLLSLNFSVDRQYLVGDHYFDFRVGDFLIEYNGSIYHSTQYENQENKTSKVPPSTFKNSNYHKYLMITALENNFRLIQIWDYDWKERKDFICKLLSEQLSGIANYRDYLDDQSLINNDYGFIVDGEQVEPKSLWVCTSNPKRIVDESYTKGRVLVYNSGFTRIC